MQTQSASPSTSASYLSMARRHSPWRATRTVLQAAILLLTITIAHSKSIAFPEIGEGAISLKNTTIRRSGGNSTCIIVGCDSRMTPTSEHFWNFYRKSGYVTTQMRFETLWHKGVRGAPNWCRIPTVIHELRRYPGARVLYIDTDTRVDFRAWCNMQSLDAKAPIIMNSAFRNAPSVQPDYTVHGSQVQTNAFIAAPGKLGIHAMKRWENAYYSGMYQDQGT